MTNIIRLPGLIDVHTHLRDDASLKWAYKEDFESGTKAALAGGYTCVLDMPNNPEAVVSAEALEHKLKHAVNRVYCDLGCHFGASTTNMNEYNEVISRVFGLKIYMNHTTGQLLINDKTVLEHIFESWPASKPILVHAEADMLFVAISLARKYAKRLHACHVSLKEEILMIKKAKQDGLPITCEVSCHHLFLTEQDVPRLQGFGRMKPPLASKNDVQALWQNLDVVDCIASDHAPHSKEEKRQPEAPYGVPGLETSLPLMLDVVSKGKLTIERIEDLMSHAPRRIFNIPDQPNTYIEVDLDETWEIANESLFTKAGWTPFDGMRVTGRVKKVVLRGAAVFQNGEIIGDAKGRVLLS